MTNMPDEQRKTVIEKYGSEEEFHKHFEEQMSRKGWIRLFHINDQEKASLPVAMRLFLIFLWKGFTEEGREEFS